MYTFTSLRVEQTLKQNNHLICTQIPVNIKSTQSISEITDYIFGNET